MNVLQAIIKYIINRWSISTAHILRMACLFLGDSFLFPFAQMDVHDSAAQEQRYTNPRQVKAVAEVSRAQLPRVVEDFFIVQSVNEHSGEGVEAGKCLTDPGEVKESSFRYGEELSQEYQE